MLTTLLAGPLMACFTNVFESPDVPMFIMDRLILEKENALVNIIKHVYRSMKPEIFKFRSSNDGLLQIYLAKSIF